MYENYLDRVFGDLASLVVTDAYDAVLGNDDGFEAWCSMTCELKEYNATLYIVGNGASAMISSHMAADASKNGQIRARALNDVALLTAVGNDLAYDEVFAVPLMRYADPGDVLLTISSSGNSPNIIRAIEQARTLGMKVITLSGMKPNNHSRSMGDLNFYVPAPTYGIVECAHQVLMHYWLDLYITRNVDGIPTTLRLPE